MFTLVCCVMRKLFEANARAVLGAAAKGQSAETKSIRSHIRSHELVNLVSGLGNLSSCGSKANNTPPFGLSFKGKQITEATVRAAKNLLCFVSDVGCSNAYCEVENVCPEFREPTMLMRAAQICSSRSANSKDDKDTVACSAFQFLLHSLKVLRMFGTLPKGDVLTILKVFGQAKTPALAQELFKKLDLIDYVLHEVALVDPTLASNVFFLRTPLALVTHFSDSVEKNPAVLENAVDGQVMRDFDATFAPLVSDFQNGENRGASTQTLIDFMWLVWSGSADEEIHGLCQQDAIGGVAANNFMWHRYLQDSNTQIALKYRQFVEACTSGPIVAGDNTQQLNFLGTSAFSEAEREDVKQVQDLLLNLRRKTISFQALATFGQFATAEYAKEQLEKTWEQMRLGFRFARKKDSVRAFCFSAELFSPNVALHGAVTSTSIPIAADTQRMRKVVDFILCKRHKDDLILLFDGRSRLCRKVLEEYDIKLSSAGNHSLHECWLVYTMPRKDEDPRIPGRAQCLAANNTEVCLFSLPTRKGASKIVQRAEFNNCGEASTSSPTYTGIQIRRYSELPRMDEDTKMNILGAAASGAPSGNRVKNDIEGKGHPFSHNEVKPIVLWQRIMEHLGVTHIVDFTPGSGALAIAASGAMEYEGVASNAAHCNWLDSTLDRCVVYMAGRDKEFSKKLAGPTETEFVEKVEKYFSGTLMEARRLLGPGVAEENEHVDASSDESEVA